jgi:hypothetical protein
MAGVTGTWKVARTGDIVVFDDDPAFVSDVNQPAIRLPYVERDLRRFAVHDGTHLRRARRDGGGACAHVPAEIDVEGSFERTVSEIGVDPAAIVVASMHELVIPAVTLSRPVHIAVSPYLDSRPGEPRIGADRDKHRIHERAHKCRRRTSRRGARPQSYRGRPERARDGRIPDYQRHLRFDTAAATQHLQAASGLFGHVHGVAHPEHE